MALAIEPASVGIAPTAELPRVFGVVMDMGMDRGTATFVGFADGSVSMYYSSGGGIVGAGEHEQIRTAAHQLFLIAEVNLTAFGATTQAALPPENHTLISVLTFDGPLRASAATDDFGYGRVPGSPVFHAVHEVIARLRELDPSPS